MKNLLYGVLFGALFTLSCGEDEEKVVNQRGQNTNVVERNGSDLKSEVQQEIVNELNRVAQGQNLEVLEDEELEFKFDFEFAAGSATIEFLEPPSIGVLTLLEDGRTAKYIPNANAFGDDKVVFVVAQEDLKSDPTEINIKVISVNDVPQFPELKMNVQEDGAGALTLVATDPDDQELEYSLTTPPENGDATLDVSSGQVFYNPDANFNGTDTFTLTVKDAQGATSQGIVTVTIEAFNDAPDGSDTDLGFSLSQGGTLQENLVGSDVDGDTLTFTITQQPTQGEITSLNAQTGAFEYSLANNAAFLGTDTFKYTVSDGVLTSEEVTVNLTAN